MNHWRNKIYHKIPRWIRKHDFELFFAFLCFWAGLPLLLGNVKPKSLESQLPDFVVIGWAFVLVVGPVLVVSGIYRSYSGNSSLTDRIFWMRTESLGLAFLGISAALYGACILISNIAQGWAASMIIFAFSLTCLTRELGVQDRIDRYKSGAGINGLDE